MCFIFVHVFSKWVNLSTFFWQYRAFNFFGENEREIPMFPPIPITTQPSHIWYTFFFPLLLLPLFPISHFASKAYICKSYKITPKSFNQNWVPTSQVILMLLFLDLNFRTKRFFFSFDKMILENWLFYFYLSSINFCVVDD